jgi:hypothetical protein
VPESILNKALEFLGQPQEERLSVTKKHEETPPEVPEPEIGEPDDAAGDPLLRANQELQESFPNLIFEDDQTDRVLEWLRHQGDVSLDIETYGVARRKEERSKKALSFVQGTIRLVQLSAGGKTFTLWTAHPCQPTS